MDFIWFLLIALLTLLYFWHNSIREADMQDERKQMLAMQREERKNLYDRLMAGSLPAYKEQIDEKPAQPDAPHDDRFVDLDEAREEIVNG